MILFLRHTHCSSVNNSVTINIAGDDIIIPDFDSLPLEQDLQENTEEESIDLDSTEEIIDQPQFLRTSGPNHIFEIFLSPQNFSQSKLPIVDFSKQPAFKLPKIQISTKKNNSDARKQKDAIKRNKENVVKSDSKSSSSSISTSSCREPSESLEECVDSCTSLDDILLYSSCVVDCSRICQ